MIDATDLASRLERVRRQVVAAGGRDVTVVAVTKGFGRDAIDAALAVGCEDVGENYAQEAVAKFADRTRGRPRLHFIGRLQSNKVAMLAPIVELWQSVDRASLAPVLATHAPGARVLVQVNVTDEENKGGCRPTDTHDLVGILRRNGLNVEGLMTVGRTGDPADARVGFAELRSLADELSLPVRSMGMSDDFEVAVSEGATMVRIGSALFGPRPSTNSQAD